MIRCSDSPLRRSCALLLGSALLLFAGGCSSRTRDDVPAFEITYENRGIGEGISQLYQFTLRDDGSVRYEGKQGVKLLGEQHATIPPERVQSIRKAIGELRFFELQEYYSYGSDAMVQTLSLTCEGQARTIHFDDGASFLAMLTPEYCKEIGMEYHPMTELQLEHLRLEQFSDLLGQTVGIHDWIGTDEEAHANRYWLERDHAAGR